MEIEKKYRVIKMPENLERYPKKIIEQGYVCVKPVVRIRKSNEEYYLTYKSKIGLDESVGIDTCVSNEFEAPLTESGYFHLKKKIDGYMVEKVRYCIPIDQKLTAELDVFEGRLKGLIIVEVEFDSEEEAHLFQPPDWFGEDVSSDHRFKNNYLSEISDYSCLGI